MNKRHTGRGLGVLFLVVVCALGLCACGQDKNKDGASNQLVLGETRTYWESFALTPEIKDWDQPIVFEENGGWGFKSNKTGEVVVEPVYDNYDAFHYGIGRVRGTVDGQYGWWLVDIHGNILKYDNVSGFHAGVAIVERNGKFGVINTESKLIVPMDYDEIFPSYAYDEETGTQRRVTYGVRDGVWVQLNLEEGYESVYEPVEKNKEYDSTISLADHKILVVNNMLLVDGSAQNNGLDFPICALHNVEFDLYRNNEKIGRYPCQLTAGLYEGDIDLSFDCGYNGLEDTAYFGVLASNQSPLVTVEEEQDWQQYLPAIKQYLQANGAENTEINCVKCYVGDFNGTGQIGVLLEINDTYRNPEVGLLEKENWTEADFNREKVAFVNAILYFPDRENPLAACMPLASHIWRYVSDDHEMTEHIYLFTDVNHDGAMELVGENQYYEYLDYSMKDIVYVRASQPMIPADGSTKE